MRSKGTCKCVDDAGRGPQTLRNGEGSAGMRGVMNTDKVLVNGSGLLRRPKDC